MRLSDTSFSKETQKAYLASICGCSVDDIDDEDCEEYNLCTGRGKNVLLRPAGTPAYCWGREFMLRNPQSINRKEE